MILAAITLLISSFTRGNPLWPLLAVSVVVGLLMVLLFRFVSNQKAIARAKDRLKANLLAVRLFQDQLPVVLGSYLRILRGTGAYLRLAFTPFLVASLPIIFLMVQMDRYFGSAPLQPAQSFLIEAQVSTPAALNGIGLQLPAGLTDSAPAVHIPAKNLAVWRIFAERPGRYEIGFAASGHSATKEVVVGAGLHRLSPVRVRGSLWERMLSSAEPAIPDGSAIQSITVRYPVRNIGFAGLDWNWMVLFFVVSLAAGFVFKTIFGIQI